MERVIQSRLERVKKKRFRKRLFRLFLLTVLIIVGTGSFFAAKLFGALSKGHDDLGKSKWREAQVEIKKDPFTILLIGSDQLTSDTEKKESWRPDVLLVAAINPKTNSMKLVSIPRDTYVEIANTPGHKDKINASAWYGTKNGAGDVKNTIETVQNFLHVPIDYYAKVNFKGFMDAVDTLGGVDVNVPFYFSTQNHLGQSLKFNPGPQHLNGEQALAYVRMRKKDPMNDHGRNKRQQEVIAALLERMLSTQGLAKFTEVTEVVGENFSYSFKPSDFPSLLATYNKVKKNMETIQLKTYGEKRKSGGRSVWFEICSDSERKRVSRILQQQIEYVPKEDMKQSDAYTSEGKNGTR
ncbi:LCP family protein [Lihuaxuella thermophila]|uniref:Cell envelope-related function transcriptional attenuator common domain-containing protein n=1 Tax=Lihuaxuella thermophila TaxID=1173111 RepID=A0A1H8B9R4_9BACL|nr:LCP family protein [Lihuaxuella thermophila]SEM78768.1 cell envelope-related function transcriptional attenuator common domain-containing protein [Lihuaxuella thermophila]